MVPLANENAVGFCKQITLYYISSRLVTLLKVADARIQVSDIFYLLLLSSSSISAFRYSFFLFLKCLLTSLFTLCTLSTLPCLGHVKKGKVIPITGLCSLESG